MHALTDVTGFGLLGHALELSRGAGLTARIRYADLPWLPGVEAFARAGVFTGASGRNWARTARTSCSRPRSTIRHASCSPIRRPRAACSCRCAPEAVDDVLAIFRADGFDEAAVIGEMVDGVSRVEVN